MKKIILSIISAAAIFCLGSCGKQEAEVVDALDANFEISPNPCEAGGEVYFTSTTLGGRKPYSCTWTIDDLTKEGEEVKHTFTKNGTYTVVLDVTDDLGNKASKRKLVVVNPASIKDKGSLDLKWVGYMEGYNAITTAAVADDGSVYSATRSNILYKFSSTGEKLWEKTIFTATNKGQTYGTPSIDADGTVFIGGGSGNGDATFKAYSPDGSEKWSYTAWWSSNGTPAAAYHGVIGVVDGDNIYFGNAGQSGTIQSVNKKTGARNGFAAPAGGLRTGVVCSKSGWLSWYGGQWGCYGIAKSTLDNGGDTKQSHAWALYNDKNADTYAQKSAAGGIALLTVDGRTCVCGMASDKVGTKVYAIDIETGEEKCVYYIEGAAPQDQGGVVVTPEGYIVASLAFTTGQDNGGIAVVDPVKKDLVWSFNVQEKVAGSCAIDNNGNIHFGTESGHYYVVDKYGNLIVKQNIAEAVLAKDPEHFADLRTAKIWSSVVIGDDGVCYLCFTDYDTKAFGGVFAAVIRNSNGDAVCSGPASEGWPMFGKDRRHTNHE